jgi:hypothetical protein
MTKAMRWGFSAVFAMGCVGLGTVAGCSEDEDVAPPVDTDTGTPADTGTADTGTPTDTGTPPTDSGGGDTPTDAPPFAADRAATVVFASPDLGRKFLCAGAFAGDPAAATSAPARVLGPPAGDPTMAGMGLPFGTIAHIPLTKEAQDVLDTPLSIVLYLLDNNTKDCTMSWADVRGTPSKWFAIKGTKAAGADATNSVKPGEHALIRIHGCAMPAAATTGECGTAATPANLKIDMVKLDTATPAMFSGTMGPKVGMQFVHMSPFAGSATPPRPPFQAVDIYIQPMTKAVAGSDAGADDSGDTGAVPSSPAGTPIKIATNVKYGDIAPSSVGVQLAGDPASSLMLITPTGVMPCTPGSTGCLTIPLPVGGAAAKYNMLGLGGFNDGTNQFVGLVGSPLNAASIGLPVGKVFKK